MKSLQSYYRSYMGLLYLHCNYRYSDELLKNHNSQIQPFAADAVASRQKSIKSQINGQKSHDKFIFAFVDRKF